MVKIPTKIPTNEVRFDVIKLFDTIEATLTIFLGSLVKKVTA
jgi:hypothetical protein